MSKRKRSEQPNKVNRTETSTIETEDYQFLLSLEENRKSTIYSRVSTIITCASLLWAMAIIIPETILYTGSETIKEILLYAIGAYSIIFCNLPYLCFNCYWRKTNSFNNRKKRKR